MLKRRRIISVFAALLLPVLGMLAGWRGTYYFVVWFLDPEYPYELSVIPRYTVETLAISAFGFLVGLVTGIALLLWAFSSETTEPLPKSHQVPRVGK
jgi:ABC-type phosphate/phosphonate transport system permease subunit